MDDMRANGWQGKPIDVFEKFRREFPDGTALEYVEYCYRILEMAVLGPAPIVEWNGAIFNGSWGTERFPDMRAWNEANTDDFLPAFDVATANHLTPDAGYTAGGLDAWMKKSFSETPHPDHPLFKFSNANLQLCAQRLKNWDSQGGINEVKFEAFVSAHLLEWAIPAGHYDQLYTQWAIGHILLVKGTVQLDPDSQTASAGTAGFQELPETAAVTTPPTGFGAEYIRGSDKGGGVGGMLYSKRWVNGAWAAGYALEDARGDVTTKTDANGAVTWQATYEAFGMRTAESGTNSDRQRANTKDEDPTGLLNEGFRYRDLEAGVFISRDPLGFVDGPNVYCYVRQNPWTGWDPEGLAATSTDKGISSTTTREPESDYSRQDQFSQFGTSSSPLKLPKELVHAEPKTNQVGAPQINKSAERTRMEDNCSGKPPPKPVADLSDPLLRDKLLYQGTQEQREALASYLVNTYDSSSKGYQVAEDVFHSAGVGRIDPMY